MFGDHEPNMYATSGALLPRTAVSTFCRTWSLGVTSWVTWTSGCSLLYWSSSLVKFSACTSVQPFQTVILVGPPAEPPPPPPPQAASAKVRAAIRTSKRRGRVTVDTPSHGAGWADGTEVRCVSAQPPRGMVEHYTRMRSKKCAFAQSG